MKRTHPPSIAKTGMNATGTLDPVVTQRHCFAFADYVLERHRLETITRAATITPNSPLLMRSAQAVPGVWPTIDLPPKEFPALQVPQNREA